MIWLPGLIVALLILATDFISPQPVAMAQQHVLLGIFCLALAPGFAMLQSWVTVRRWSNRPIQSHRAVFLHRSLMGSNFLVWLFGCVAMLLMAKWPQLIRENWQFDRVPLLDEVALALPMIASLLLSWVLIFDAEKTLNQVSHASRRGLASQRVRTFVGLVLVPVLLLFLGRDVARLVFPDGLTPVATCLSFAGFVFLLVNLYPMILSLTWRTRAIEDAQLNDLLSRTATDAGMPNEKFLCWATDGTVTNALVVGLLPRLRRVFFSDQLLERFSHQEIAAIYRHELGHIVYRHLMMRLALILVPLITLCVMALVFKAEVSVEYASSTIPFAVFLLVIVGFFYYANVVVANFVRKSEIQADMFAITDRRGIVNLQHARDYCDALLKLAASSPELYEHSTLVHPSIKLRLAILRQVMDSPDSISRFHRKFHKDQQVAAICLFSLVMVAVLLNTMI